MGHNVHRAEELETQPRPLTPSSTSAQHIDSLALYKENESYFPVFCRISNLPWLLGNLLAFIRESLAGVGSIFPSNSNHYFTGVTQGRHQSRAPVPGITSFVFLWESHSRVMAGAKSRSPDTCFTSCWFAAAGDATEEPLDDRPPVPTY